MSGMGLFFEDDSEFPESFHDNSDIPESWNDGEKAEVLNILKLMDETYPNYDPPKGVKIVDVSEESNSLYLGRGKKDASPGNATMEINKSRRLESTAHELGHDLENNIFEDYKCSEMEKFTFKEFLADLNALTFTDIEPANRSLDRAPFKFDYDKNYRKAKEAVNPIRREREISYFEDLITYIEDNEYDEIDENLNFAKAPPYLSDKNPQDTGSCMLVDSLNDLDKLRQLKKNIVLENNLIQDKNPDEIGKFLIEKIYGEDSSSMGAERVQTPDDLFSNYDKETLRNRGFQVVTNEMQEDLYKAAIISSNHLDWIEGGITREKLFEELNNIGYGKNFDFYVSLPHEVGGLAAEKQYFNGLRPVEVVYNKDSWAEYLRDELLFSIEQVYGVEKF